MILSIEKRKVCVTAAHIIDSIETHALYLVGTVGNQPVKFKRPDEEDEDI